jgi:hypothetical protein
MRKGQSVHVWNRFLGSWAGPFEVVGVEEDGALIRRPGDREPLPNRFPADQLAVSDGAPHGASGDSLPYDLEQDRPTR